jgi:hypothetical protein
MSKSAITKLFQSSTRKISPFQVPARSIVCQHRSLPIRALPSRSSPHFQSLPAARCFSTGKQQSKGLTPDSSDPPPRTPESTSTQASGPAEISIDQYHELSDIYLNSLVEQLEQLQEEREEVDCEYTVNRPLAFLLFVLNLKLTYHSTTVGSSHSRFSTKWHVRNQQAAPKQTNLAIESYYWPQEI